MRLAAGLLTLSLAWTASVAAQDHAVIAGRAIHKASKAAIAGAEVVLNPGAVRLLSDSAGYFHFDSVRPGILSLLVRRFGFRPESATFEVAAREDLDVLVELEELPQELDTVTVAARGAAIPRGKLAGFYQRRRFATGRFIDSTVLLKEQNRMLGELITSRSPGSRLVRSRLGTAAWIATTRRSGATLLPRSTVDPTDLARGADPRACYSDVYMDGTLVYSFGHASPLFDVNSVSTSTVAAIELYVGPAQTPTEYNKTGAACGVLLIWMK